ncbi:MAG: UDP-N-acetylmuramoyl-L-alanyl-D-glutamate--2,6-diaminopimelate ligase [Gammaproteobacteria bacterium]|nr:UDP-N-acetylmuramoyl-L-alanyl-D-glutamate--2,6-diaminopimelate ligase [Gammaproteobacteria bacterium]
MNMNPCAAPITPAPLAKLLAGMVAVAPEHDRLISGLALDSREVKAGDVFFARQGTQQDGSRYIDAAVAAGAIAVVADSDTTFSEPHVPTFRVAHLDAKLGEIAARFFNYPARDLSVIGITGTNGKTSCSQFTAQVLSTPACPAGIIGTVGNGVFGALTQSLHTTPDAIALQRWLHHFREQGLRYVAMEVSSHGLDQGRVNGVDFSVAVLTNLSRDHLDYHGDMESYAAAKSLLFTRPGLRYAVLNMDDELGQRLATTLPAGVQGVGYSLAADTKLPRGMLHVLVNSLTLSPAGIAMDVLTPWGDHHVSTPLLGRFNASNVLAVLATALALGMPLGEAAARIASLQAPPGRMECFGGGAGQPLVVVDYAHTPDALEQVLSTLREHTTGDLWCVFGCGGDRDRGKRPQMAAVSEHYAHRLVITDDNPRREDPQQIIQDIQSGLKYPNRAQVQRDRAQAIALALAQAAPGDVVLVAGKGHEDYQIIGTQRRHYSDRETVAHLLGVTHA